MHRQRWCRYYRIESSSTCSLGGRQLGVYVRLSPAMTYKHGPCEAAAPKSGQSKYVCIRLFVGKPKRGKGGMCALLWDMRHERSAFYMIRGLGKKQTESVEDSRRRMETDNFRLPRMQQFPPLMILLAQAAGSECMQNLRASMRWIEKLSGGTVEVTNSSSSNQQQSKGLYRSPKKGCCLSAKGGRAAADD